MVHFPCRVLCKPRVLDHVRHELARIYIAYARCEHLLRKHRLYRLRQLMQARASHIRKLCTRRQSCGENKSTVKQNLQKKLFCTSQGNAFLIILQGRTMSFEISRHMMCDLGSSFFLFALLLRNNVRWSNIKGLVSLSCFTFITGLAVIFSLTCFSFSWTSFFLPLFIV